MKNPAAEALSALIGKPMWSGRRAADMATFQFGSHIKKRDPLGMATEVGDFALHVQCAWRIVRGNRILVGSRDLYYPADYKHEREGFPEDFDWDASPNRRDRLLGLVFEGGTKELLVQGVDVAAAGSFRIAFGDDYALEVFPESSLPDEQWRLLSPSSEDRPQFSAGGMGADE